MRDAFLETMRINFEVFGKGIRALNYVSEKATQKLHII